MDKQLIEGYIAGITFIIVSFLLVINSIHTDLMLASNEFSMVLGVIFGILGIGSLVKPESIGQITAEWARRLQKNVNETDKSPKKNTIIVQQSGPVGGDLNIVAGSEDTTIKKKVTRQKKGKNT
jgi:hypothetical protein